jgi:hypothetical protein
MGGILAAPVMMLMMMGRTMAMMVILAETAVTSKTVATVARREALEVEASQSQVSNTA